MLVGVGVEEAHLEWGGFCYTYSIENIKTQYEYCDSHLNFK